MINPTFNPNIYYRVATPEETPQPDEAKLIFTQGAPRIYKRIDIEQFKYIKDFLKLSDDVEEVKQEAPFHHESEPTTSLSDDVSSPQPTTSLSHDTDAVSTTPLPKASVAALSAPATAEASLPPISSKSLKSEEPTTKVSTQDTSDKSTVSKLATRGFARLNFDDKRFDLLVSVFLKKEPLIAVAPQEFYQDPNCIEKLRQNFFFVNSASEESRQDFYLQVQKNLTYMSLEEAKQLLLSYGKCPAIQVMIVDKPAAIERALLLYLKSKLFSNEKQASDHFKKLKELRIELLRKQKERQDLIAGNQTQTLDETRRRYAVTLLSNVSEIEKQIKELEKKIPDLDMSMKQQSHFAQYIEDPFLAETAKLCQSTVAEYQALVKEAIEQHTGPVQVNKRKDLMEYLIGPKEFLFEKYGIVANKLESGQCHLNHQNPGSQDEYIYELDKLGPMELEEEIREDVRKHIDVSKIPMSVTERIRTKPDLEEDRLLDEIYDTLNAWRYTSEQNVKDVKQKLIAFNGLNKLDINPCDISLSIVNRSVLALAKNTTASVRVKKFGKEFEFTFHLRDLIIRDANSNRTALQVLQREQENWIMSTPPQMPNNVQVTR